jgi:Flp pilus assembly protein TadD
LKQAANSLGLEVGDQPPGGFLARLFFAGSILSFYFCKSLSPVGLLPVYPRWTADASSVSTWLAWICIVGAIAVCWMKRRSWGRPVLLGLGFFLINLIPFVGLNAGPYMALSWVMDHILYLPIIGLIGLAAAGAGRLAETGRVARECTKGIAALLVGVLAFASHSYAGLYRDSETLWTYALSRNPDAWPGHNVLGAVLLDKGDAAGAAEEFRKTVELCPDYAKAHANLGLALAQLGRLDDALAEFQKSVQLNDTNAAADSNLGTALMKKGRVDDAIAAFRLALKMDPRYAGAHFNLALALAQKGDAAGAIDEYRAVLAIVPDSAQAHLKLAELLMQTGNAAEAAQHYDAALKNDPNYQKYRSNLTNPPPSSAP